MSDSSLQMSEKDAQNRVTPSLSDVPSSQSRKGHGQSSLADWIEAIFNLSIPITVAVSTIILAIQQHVLIQNNREQDLLIAAAQRKTDLEITRSQREENKKIFHRQRVKDLDTLQSERLQALSITELRRKNDFKLAADRRYLDRLSTRRCGNSCGSSSGRSSSRENIKQKEALVGHERELSHLLFLHDLRMLSEDSQILFDLTLKTRSSLRRPNPSQRTLLFHSPVDTSLINKEFGTLDNTILKYADLRSRDFYSPHHVQPASFNRYYAQFDLYSADLHNASFRSVTLAGLNVNFSAANLNSVD